MLYLCSTPIGNLEDITLRVLRILKEADLIAAEDTRHTIKLLNHYNISKPLVSYHEHNRLDRGPELIEILKSGKTIAYCSDAGMPGISDPGADLVVLARQENIVTTVLPGPSAAPTALVLSGLSTERFAFEGFLPKSKKARNEILEKISREERTLIIYESPHRLKRTLNDLHKHLGDRPISIVRELTKIHEQVLPSTMEEALAYYDDKQPRGEFVLVVEGIELEVDCFEFTDISIEEHILRYIKSGFTKKEAIKLTARDRDIPKSEVYKVSIGIGIHNKPL
ncbi:MAG TPA: 16S rRNA (cytidine(1402)-2'-O)-methyltransferase [Bacillota bacterium]|nr:16S rRNA (cytidine(1402)-2'-O)-methyltransferase [Bacillota bacterium]